MQSLPNEFRITPSDLDGLHCKWKRRRYDQGARSHVLEYFGRHAVTVIRNVGKQREAEHALFDFLHCQRVGHRTVPVEIGRLAQKSRVVVGVRFADDLDRDAMGSKCAGQLRHQDRAAVLRNAADVDGTAMTLACRQLFGYKRQIKYLRVHFAEACLVTLFGEQQGATTFGPSFYLVNHQRQ